MSQVNDTESIRCTTRSDYSCPRWPELDSVSMTLAVPYTQPCLTTDQLDDRKAILFLHSSSTLLISSHPFIPTKSGTNMYCPPHRRSAITVPQSPVDEMTSGLTERVSIISSAKVRPSDDITFKSPRVVGGYNWIDNDDNEPIVAVPGMSGMR